MRCIHTIKQRRFCFVINWDNWDIRLLIIIITTNAVHLCTDKYTVENCLNNGIFNNRKKFVHNRQKYEVSKYITKAVISYARLIFNKSK